MIEQTKTLTFGAVGECITDEYVYVNPAGKSAKENVIAYTRESVEAWHGGIDVIAAHLAEITANVCVTTQRDPVIKRRFVHKPFMTKVFQEVEQSQSAEMTALPSAHPSVIADFGHGFLRLWKTWPVWYALTCQSNSLNWGFNPATKWVRPDYVVLDTYEAQLALQSRVAPRDAALMLRDRMHAGTVVVTMGHEGAVMADGDGATSVVSMSSRPLDRMGAGDAFLAWSAPFAYVKAPTELTGLFGAAAAAVKVETAGNGRFPLERVLERLKAR